LIVAWALVGSAALYFPAPFQRKLAMGLAVPWAVCAALGLATVLERLERSSRNMVAALALAATCATSLLWLQRELIFVRDDVARTAVHSVFYSRDARRIIDLVGAEQGRKVVLAMPGVMNATGPASFGRPTIPDLNAVMSGMAGATTYAGHWSETPDYADRRNRLTKAFLARTPDSERAALLQETGAAYVVQPNPAAFQAVEASGSSSLIADFRPFGELVYEGSQLWLVRVRSAAGRPAP
jgi:arabinosyltransferase C